jgi:hypothetical protein
MTRPKAFALILVGWTAFGLLSSAHFYFGSAADGDGVSFADLARHIFTFYWAWAALTPVVVWLARFSLRGEGEWWRRWTPAVLGSALVIPLHGLLYLTAVSPFDSTVRLDAAHFEKFAMRHGGGDLATYAVLIGAYLLLEAERTRRRRELATSQAEAARALAELEVLRLQLHPHFLFNALNTVSTLVIKGDAIGAERAILLIGDYLRAALAHKSERAVSLALELEFVRRYFAIEQLRFGDDLLLELKVEPGALAGCMPALILQPLVENGIRHGVARSCKGGTITIAAVVESGRMRVSVADVRSDEAILDSPGADRTSGEGFGLRYVRERLREIYGERAVLTLSTSERGSVALLDLPFVGVDERRDYPALAMSSS